MAAITGRDSYAFFNPLDANQYTGTTGGDTPLPSYTNEANAASSGGTTSESDYMRSKYLSGSVNFNTYKRPLIRPPPPPDSYSGPNTAVSQSEYYKKKYGVFYNPETVWATPAKLADPKPQLAIVGTDRATQGDVELLQRTVDAELLRIQNLRSSAPDMMARMNALDVLSSDLNELLGKVRRDEIQSGKEGQVGNFIPIRASDAREFMKTFKTATVLPRLIDDSLETEPVATAAPAPVSAPAPTVAYAPSSTAAKEEVTMFDDIQNLKWQIDMMLNPAKYQAGEMAKRLSALEKRIIRYSLTDAPMPADLASGFREEILKLKKTIQQ